MKEAEEAIHSDLSVVLKKLYVSYNPAFLENLKSLFDENLLCIQSIMQVE